MANMIKRILLIAYHFPPVHGSSGLLRTLKFVNYLPDHGYLPYVLTVHPRVYGSTDDNLLSQISKTVIVKRAWALDTGRHLSLRGAYLDFMAIPDRLATWILPGTLSAVRMIHKYKIDLIYSTYPIASAHLIGYLTNRITKCPWIADFRDPMYDESTQLKKTNLNVRKSIEGKTIRRANHVIVTTEGIRQIFLDRYPQLQKSRLTVVPNGFDEQDFKDVDTIPLNGHMPIRMMHAGLLEPVDRDPSPFFEAIKRSIKSRGLTGEELIVEFFAPGQEQEYRRQLARLGLSEIIKIRPSISYHKILRKMREAHILLLFQGPSCNKQIPAKAYEYLRVRRPILALTPDGSETARLVNSTGAGIVVSPHKSEEIVQQLELCIDHIRQGKSLPTANFETIKGYSRQSQTSLLAQKLDEVLENTKGVAS